MLTLNKAIYILHVLLERSDSASFPFATPSPNSGTGTVRGGRRLARHSAADRDSINEVD
jgi:hypothetical protein